TCTRNHAGATSGEVRAWCSYPVCGTCSSFDAPLRYGLPSVVSCHGVEHLSHQFGYLTSKIRGHGISDLMVLRSTWPLKLVVIRESLQSGGFTYCQAAALAWIVVNEVVAIL